MWLDVLGHLDAHELGHLACLCLQQANGVRSSVEAQELWRGAGMLHLQGWAPDQDVALREWEVKPAKPAFTYVRPDARAARRARRARLARGGGGDGDGVMGMADMSLLEEHEQALEQGHAAASDRGALEPAGSAYTRFGHMMRGQCHVIAR